MRNNTFFIVCREMSIKSPFHSHPNRDPWGWEFADLIERTDWKTAEKDLREYQAAMPSHVVRIRCVRIGTKQGRPEEVYLETV